ncbi:MAG TPA: hypothetical protein VFG42_26130 [Baekduia sp.]|nr:hypothetical protein [Baekduia sp.]
MPARLRGRQRHREVVRAERQARRLGGRRAGGDEHRGGQREGERGHGGARGAEDVAHRAAFFLVVLVACLSTSVVRETRGLSPQAIARRTVRRPLRASALARDRGRPHGQRHAPGAEPVRATGGDRPALLAHLAAAGGRQHGGVADAHADGQRAGAREAAPGGGADRRHLERRRLQVGAARRLVVRRRRAGRGRSGRGRRLGAAAGDARARGGRLREAAADANGVHVGVAAVDVGGHEAVAREHEDRVAVGAVVDEVRVGRGPRRHEARAVGAQLVDVGPVVVLGDERLGRLSKNRRPSVVKFRGAVGIELSGLCSDAMPAAGTPTGGQDAQMTFRVASS